jgi:hypothetical protein
MRIAPLSRPLRNVSTLSAIYGWKTTLLTLRVREAGAARGQGGPGAAAGAVPVQPLGVGRGGRVGPGGVGWGQGGRGVLG